MVRLGKLLLVLLAALSLAAFAASCNGDEEVTQTSPATALPAQSSKSGAVTVDVVPETLSAEAGTWTFKVIIDSETVESGEDLAEAAVLVGDSGPESKPTGYKGDSPGQKHREGVLEFEAITPLPRAVTLKLRGIGGVGERSFSWMLGNSGPAKP